MLGFLFVVLWTEFHCVIQASLALHPQTLILLHTDTSYHPYKAGTDHMRVTWVACGSHASHMQIHTGTCGSHADHMRIHTGHMWVACRSHVNTYRAHVGHMRVTIECVWSVLRLRNPLLSYRKAGGCQITHGNTNKLWKASLLAGPRSAAACEPESLGPSAPLLPSLALL